MKIVKLDNENAIRVKAREGTNLAKQNMTIQDSLAMDSVWDSETQKYESALDRVDTELAEGLTPPTRD